MRRTHGPMSVLLLGLAGVAQTGCPSDPPVGDPLTVEFQQAPQIQTSNGRTLIVVDFVVRRPDRTPLEPDELTVNLRIDGSPLDVESLVTEKDERLKVDLNLHLVLDVSYSMTQHQLASAGNGASTAFDLMLRTAGEARQEVLSTWLAKAEGAKVNTELTFFDLWLYHATGKWSDAQIQDFPAPPKGTATKLLGAAHFAATDMWRQYGDGIASGPRDKHVMIVFTDGADNSSAFDNTDSTEKPCMGFCSAPTTPQCKEPGLMPVCPGKEGETCHTPELGAPFTSEGYPCVDRAAIQEAFDAHPSLQVHVIGLGNNVNKQELRYLATVGRGALILGGSADDIPSLFAEAVKEFVTVNSKAADVPQPIGRYQFSMDIFEKAAPSNRAVCSFVYDNQTDTLNGTISAQAGHCVPWEKKQ